MRKTLIIIALVTMFGCANSNEQELNIQNPQKPRHQKKLEVVINNNEVGIKIWRFQENGCKYLITRSQYYSDGAPTTIHEASCTNPLHFD
jgi:hypothetical protein